MGLTQVNVRSYSRSAPLRYKIAPKYPLSGSFHHSGVGRDPEVVGPVRSYNLVFTYPCQGFPPVLEAAQQEELKGAVQQPPAELGIELANWYWKVVRQFVSERFGGSLSRSSCLNYLHCLGFALKRPKKRLVKADEKKREAFVAEYAALMDGDGEAGEKVFFVDEAHFRADAELRGKWALKGEPALMDSTSPRRDERASYYSAVCLETGEVEWMELEGNNNAATSAAFLTQLRERHSGALNVIWDNAPAYRGEAVREYLQTPELNLRLGNLCLEPVYNLFRISTAKERTTICRLVLSFPSQFFHSRRHFSSQAKDRSTIQRFGSTTKVCSSLRFTTSTEAPSRFCTVAAKGFPV